MIEDTPKEGSNQMMVIGGVIAIVAIVGVIFFATRSGNTKTAMASPSPQIASKESENLAMTDTPQVEGTSSDNTVVIDKTARQITVDAGSFYYKPNSITVKKGEKIQIIMKSVDMMHDFNIDELNVHLPITKSGQTNTVVFTADTVGKFEYYCSVGQHRKNGQVGTIVVTN